MVNRETMPKRIREQVSLERQAERKQRVNQVKNRIKGLKNEIGAAGGILLSGGVLYYGFSCEFASYNPADWFKGTKALAERRENSEMYKNWREGLRGAALMCGG